MSKTSHVTKNQPFTAGSIGCSSDVTIMLGCGDRKQACVIAIQEGTLYSESWGSHYRHTKKWNPSSLLDII